MPEQGYAMFIGLNPSTAGDVEDDPTIRRCIQFAKDWGYGALCMTNLFAFRATDPAVMKSYSEPIGSDTDAVLAELAKNAGVVVAAWGNHGKHLGRCPTSYLFAAYSSLFESQQGWRTSSSLLSTEGAQAKAIPLANGSLKLGTRNENKSNLSSVGIGCSCSRWLLEIDAIFYRKLHRGRDAAFEIA